MIHVKIISAITFFLCISKLFAFEQESFADSYNKYGLRIYSGSIIAHAKDVENTAGSRPLVFEAEYYKRHLSESVWNLCRCYPGTGFNLAFKDYDNDVLGYGFHVAYFVEYHFFKNLRVSPAIRGSTGLEYNTNPYHKVNNPYNQSYSFYLNAFLQFSFLTSIRINDNLFLDFQLAFNHISNGGLRQPNRGINWPSLGGGIFYTAAYSPSINRSEQIPEIKECERSFHRVSLNFSAHSKTFEKKERFLIVASDYLFGYRINNLNTLLLGIDYSLDYSLKRHIEYYNLDYSPNRFGVVGGHEFTMGDFGFSQKLGAYIYNEPRLNDLVYHKWSLCYNLYNGFMLGVELKAHRHVAEFVTFNVGFEM